MKNIYHINTTTMEDINPYQILGIPNDANINTVNEAYKALALKNHPDKGGNPETFKIIRLAFKMVVNNIKKGIQIPKNNSSTFIDLKSQSTREEQPVKYPTPQEFFGKTDQINPNKGFDSDTFNQKFLQNKKNDDGDGDTVQIDNNDYREKRTKEQLLSEQQHIDDEMSNIKPIFVGKDFDNNVFQRLYEHVNGTPDKNVKELQVYEEPEALTSGLQPYTEIDDQLKLKMGTGSGSSYGDINHGFGQKIPSQFDKGMITKFSGQPNITDVNVIESDYHSKMKQRLNDYQNVKVNVHPKPANMSQLPEGIKEQKSTESKLTQQNMNDAFNRKMQERNGLFAPQQQQQQQQQPRSVTVMDYPRNSNGDDLGGGMPSHTTQSVVYQQHPSMYQQQQPPMYQQQPPLVYQQQPTPVYQQQPSIVYQQPIYQPPPIYQQQPIYQQSPIHRQTNKKMPLNMKQKTEDIKSLQKQMMDIQKSIKKLTKGSK